MSVYVCECEYVSSWVCIVRVCACACACVLCRHTGMRAQRQRRTLGTLLYHCLIPLRACLSLNLVELAWWPASLSDPLSLPLEPWGDRCAHSHAWCQTGSGDLNSALPDCPANTLLLLQSPALGNELLIGWLTLGSSPGGGRAAALPGGFPP